MTNVRVSAFGLLTPKARVLKMQLFSADIIIIAAYLLLTVIIGILGSRRASGGLDEFFLAGRRVNWFFAGTSMVATTFAADTPLWVTGTVAKYGIAGNWLWWNMAIGHLMAAVIFAPLWRRSRVITDAELIELRYGQNHRPATILRSVKAFYFSLVFNIITMGWVILAMKKIITAVLGSNEKLSTIILIALVIFAMIYSILGGLVSVIATDLVQFLLGLLGSLIMAFYALKAVGGLTNLEPALRASYANSAEILSFFPVADNSWMPISALFIYLGVQWWCQKGSDGGGYFVQRMGASRDGAAASKATFWFSIAHYAIRPWPWIIVALAALIIFPINDFPGLDREAAYPMLIMSLLPSGLKGLVICSLLAAFMSTIDTHLNWGTSYLVRDIYQRFFRPEASNRELVRISRLALLFMTILAVLLALSMESIQSGWEIFFQLGAGWGAAMILRWLWWRTNAESELAAMIIATLTTIFFFAADKLVFLVLPFHYKLFITAVLATCASIIAIYIWPVKADAPHLQTFYQMVNPPGFWQNVANKLKEKPKWESPSLAKLAALTACGTAAIYGLLFGLGKLLFGEYLLGGLLLIAALPLTAITWHGLNKYYGREKQASKSH